VQIPDSYNGFKISAILVTKRKIGLIFGMILDFFVIPDCAWWNKTYKRRKNFADTNQKYQYGTRRAPIMEKGNSKHSSSRSRIYCIYYGYTKFARKSSVTGIPREWNAQDFTSVRFRFCLRFRPLEMKCCAKEGWYISWVHLDDGSCRLERRKRSITALVIGIVILLIKCGRGTIAGFGVFLFRIDTSLLPGTDMRCF